MNDAGGEIDDPRAPCQVRSPTACTALRSGPTSSTTSASVRRLRCVCADPVTTTSAAGLNRHASPARARLEAPGSPVYASAMTSASCWSASTGAPVSSAKVALTSTSSTSRPVPSIAIERSAA
jgi:hypothetical protein